MDTSGNLKRWVKYLSQDNSIRVVVIQAPDLVQELCNAHEVRGRSSIAFGEAILSALFLASYCKLGERVNLLVEGTGCFKKAFIDAAPEGTTRGYFIQNAEAGGLWEEAFFSVLRTRSEIGFQPYIGTIPVRNNSIVDTLDDYWNQSEQILTGVGMSVHTIEDSIQWAGGVLIQVLGSADEQTRVQLQSAVEKIKIHAQDYAQGKDLDIEKMLSEDFDGLIFHRLETKELAFCCTCSQEKIENAILFASDQEFLEDAKQKGGIQMTCDLCAKEYDIRWNRILELIKTKG